MSRIRGPAARLSTLRISANSPRTDSRLADAALMQMNIEFGGDAVTQVSTAPAHHAIGLEVRAVFYPLRHFAPLGFGQTRLAPRPGPVRQPSQAIRVVAMHPVAQRLPVHGTGLRGQHPRMPIQHHSNANKPTVEELPARRFAQRIAAGASATAAYTHAYGRERDNVAAVKGGQLVRKVNIRERAMALEAENALAALR